MNTFHILHIISILHSIVETSHHLLLYSWKQLLRSLKSLALTSHASLTKSVSLLLHFVRTKEKHFPTTLRYWKFISHWERTWKHKPRLIFNDFVSGSLFAIDSFMYRSLALSLLHLSCSLRSRLPSARLSVFACAIAVAPRILCCGYCRLSDLHWPLSKSLVLSLDIGSKMRVCWSQVLWDCL